MTDVSLDNTDIARMLDHPPVVIESSRAKTFCYMMAEVFCALLIWALLARNIPLQDGFSFWFSWGLVVFFLLGALLFVKITVRPPRLEISPSGIVFPTAFFVRHFSWNDLGPIHYVKGHFAGRAYIPGMIVFDTISRKGGGALMGNWDVSRADLLALLTTAQKRWGTH